ncbi:hypothetical protein [Caulobacter hibisci]|uniref:Uncharacterized protein n=1 Tax=Caulobacter hibisci TaxID=2035993 RepID=A0ABS0SS56_9CAUL|nr:hypothetical protein [Caulobacter hibisci]MBI1682346.1 hypothetical protein [Caulobacter hibisci]
MEDQHTPGPWSVSAGDLIRVKPKASNEVVAGVHRIGKHSGRPEAEALANARLIAAAPELLAAAREFMPKGLAIGNGNVPDETVIPIDVTMGELRKFEAAIAKALGQDAEGVS